MSICVCAKCKKPWKAPGSPARCLDCGQVSFAIAIQAWWQKPEYRAKQSLATKKRWQNPEYRAKQHIASIGRHHTAEAKAKISAAVIRRWHGKKGEVKSND